MEPRAGAKISFKLVWRCCQILSGFLANGQFPRVSRQSRLSANDRGDMKWSRELCTYPLAYFVSCFLTMCFVCRLVLDISGGSHGSPIITYKGHGGGNQQWFFDDDFTIRSGTGMVLDVENGASSPGARIIGYTKHGAPNQKFRIVPHNKK